MTGMNKHKRIGVHVHAVATTADGMTRFEWECAKKCCGGGLWSTSPADAAWLVSPDVEAEHPGCVAVLVGN